MPLSLTSHRQSGNVFFWILGCISLFALLSFAVSQSGRNSGRATIEAETYALLADEILNYATNVKTTVDRVMAFDGMTDTKIRLKEYYSNKSNPAYSTTPRNEVFYPEGGGLEFLAPPPKANDGTPYNFIGTMDFNNAGSPSADLLMVLQKVVPEVCAAFNKKLGLPATLTDPDGISPGQINSFNGSYFTPMSSATRITAPGLPDNAYAACIRDITGNQNVIFYVLRRR